MKPTRSNRCLGRSINARGNGENLRDELIAAATDLLTTAQDVPWPSLRSVAREVGVAPSAVYLHFASQEDLFIAVVTSLFDQLWSAMDFADDDSAEPLERLLRFASAYADWSMTHRGGYQLLFERGDLRPLAAPKQAAPGIDCEAANTPMPLADQVRSRVAEICAASGIATADLEAHTMRLWCVIHGVVSLRIHKPDEHWNTTIETDLRCILKALLTPTAASTHA